MSTSAIIMLIVFVLVIWGGMIASILKLRGHPDPPDDDPAADETT
jgi:hypothetical protein